MTLLTSDFQKDDEDLTALIDCLSQVVEFSDHVNVAIESMIEHLALASTINEVSDEALRSCSSLLLASLELSMFSDFVDDALSVVETIRSILTARQNHVPKEINNAIP
jgi:hypothetical protein